MDFWVADCAAPGRAVLLLYLICRGARGCIAGVRREFKGEVKPRWRPARAASWPRQDCEGIVLRHCDNKLKTGSRGM